MRLFLTVLMFITAACSSAQADTNTPTAIPAPPAASSTPAARPWFGIGFNQQATDELTLYVDPGGPAERAGIQNDDILLALDGETVSPETLVERFQSYAPGDTLRVTVERDGETLEFEVTLGVLPTGAAQESQVVTQNFLGITIEITNAEVIIIDILADSPADEAGIMLGDVITAVDDTPVEVPQQIFDLLRPVVPGTSVEFTLDRSGEVQTVTLTLPELQLLNATEAPRAGSPEDTLADRLRYMPRVNEWVVESIVPVGILGTAGLQVDDRIISVMVNERPQTRETLLRMLNAITPNDEITLTVERGGETVELTGSGVLAPALLAASEEENIQDAPAPEPLIPAGIAYGFTALPITEQIARSANLENNEGAVIVQVQPGTSADEAGLMSGDIVTAVNDEPVTGENPLNIQLADLEEGAAFTLTILRNGEELEVELLAQATEANVPSGSGGLPFPLPMLTPEGTDE